MKSFILFIIVPTAVCTFLVWAAIFFAINKLLKASSKANNVSVEKALFGADFAFI